MRSVRWRATLAALGAVAVIGVPATAQTRSPQATSPTTSVPDLNLPEGSVWLGSVRVPVRVTADGKALAPGTYRVRLTGEHGKETAGGQSTQFERWVEFVQNTQIRGRALAPVIPAADVPAVADGPVPARGRVRGERLKGDDYYRLWFNYRGEQVLVYLPLA